MSVPAAWRLYLPEAWATEPERRAAAGIPPEVGFLRKWEIALEEIDRLLEEDLPPAPVVADSGYGDTTRCRDALTERGFSYVVGIKPETTVCPPGKEPLPPKPYTDQGRPPKRVPRDEGHEPLPVRDLATGLPNKARKRIRWREGTKGTMGPRFAAVPVRPAHRDELRTEPRPIEWLLIEWPKGEPEPTKFWLSTVPQDVDFAELVSLAKIRGRIERDYQEMKDELGLDHYEGRGWRGFHHHGVLCMAAYCFLAAERGRPSPPRALAFLQPTPIPEGFRPRGAPRATRRP
jgi:SRSO17 transposase